MTETLDKLLLRLHEQPLDRNLVGLELAVQSRLRGQEAAGPMGFGGLARAALVGLALLFGAGVGGLSAASAAPKPALFAAADALAPSTLLESRR